MYDLIRKKTGGEWYLRMQEYWKRLTGVSQRQMGSQANKMQYIGMEKDRLAQLEKDILSGW